ncbi:putative transposase YhgA family protein [Candidatus Rickettsiella viridis]|uniref:Putative transposase YhgA family protein n=1 Tax=Candidatus Rickettsiella viridis TaxID=676208 RepID=A0A2Z5UUW5_9COXI|nr:Rpn family recombination-promoting nuclease/putative transposase [Candidatus Rickettsiella viridis]BBB15359.1 putative transposase YhgA family protein [Candidatus Rickettsiella viridis]
MTIKIYNPHDRIFKKFFTDIEVVKEFINAYFPKALQKKCDFSTLKIELGSFVEEDLRQHHSDILYSLKIDGITGYVYINVEHQSTPDELMPFRMLRYKLAIMKQHLDQGHKKLPAVIPMLFYHGKKQPYPFSLALIDCFEDVEFAKNYFFNSPLLVDISQVSDEKLTEHKVLGSLELVQKHIFTRDLEGIASALVRLMQASQIQLAHELFNALVYYMLSQGETSSVQKVIAVLLTIEDYREDVMNAAQQLKQQGLQQGLRQGRKEGRYEVAKDLLAAGMPIEQVRKLTKLPHLDLTESEKA